MNANMLSVRKQNLEDIPLIVDYFLNADTDFLLKMGVEQSKLYERTYWLSLLNDNLNETDENKKLYYITWLIDNKPVGHCNINKIITNEEAYMHLHLWQNNTRHKGLGLEFLKLSIPIFFQVHNLKRLYCEPYALNAPPNKALSKFGFAFLKEYETTPGVFNFHQLVNRWCLSKETLSELQLL